MGDMESTYPGMATLYETEIAGDVVACPNTRELASDLSQNLPIELGRGNPPERSLPMRTRLRLFFDLYIPLSYSKDIEHRSNVRLYTDSQLGLSGLNPFLDLYKMFERRRSTAGG